MKIVQRKKKRRRKKRKSSLTIIGEIYYWTERGAYVESMDEGVQQAADIKRNLVVTRSR